MELLLSVGWPAKVSDCTARLRGVLWHGTVTMAESNQTVAIIPLNQSNYPTWRIQYKLDGSGEGRTLEYR